MPTSYMRQTLFNFFPAPILLTFTLTACDFSIKQVNTDWDEWMKNTHSKSIPFQHSACVAKFGREEENSWGVYCLVASPPMVINRRCRRHLNWRAEAKHSRFEICYFFSCIIFFQYFPFFSFLLFIRHSLVGFNDFPSSVSHIGEKSEKNNKATSSFPISLSLFLVSIIFKCALALVPWNLLCMRYTLASRNFRDEMRDGVCFVLFFHLWQQIYFNFDGNSPQPYYEQHSQKTIPAKFLK